ncbi:MAG: DNA polymerase I, partial [Fimbriiglobus sp.]|nr:DNA polymerase I [Fimbriiglobus sp.]
QGAEYLLATFDCPEPTFRVQVMAEYKAHRPPPPDDLIIQEPMIDAVLQAMRIPVLKVPGYEADDVMATVAGEAVERGHDVVLCTSDKDCRQLLNDRVSIRNLRKGETLDAAGLMADWGVRPDQVVDFQALVGDSVDNVPGVPGCGPKTAAKWLKEYGTLENVVANADKLGGPKLREAFKASVANGDLARSKTLVKLRTDVPMEMNWEAWRRRDWDGQRLLELFQEFGFNSFAARVRTTLAKSGAAKNDAALALAGLPSGGRQAPESATAQGPDRPRTDEQKPKKPRPGQQSLFDQLEADDPFTPRADHWNATYTLIDTEAAFDTFLKELKQQKRFAIDLETTGLEPVGAWIVGYAISWQAGTGYYLAVRGKAEHLLDPDQTLTALKPILEDSTIEKVNHNIKYDLLVLRANGVDLAGVAGDSMVAHYLLEAGARTHNLDGLTQQYFGHANISITELIGKGKKQITMAEVPTDQAAQYASEDADAAWRLAGVLEPELEAAGLRKLYDEVEIPLIDVLAELEFNGVLLDLPLLARLSTSMGEQAAALEAKVYELAGKTFNIGSLKQLQQVMFTDLKLPVLKKTGIKGEPSTDSEVLEKLAAMGHELPKTLLAHRKVTKLKSTYVDTLPTLVNTATGRVHTSFNQTVTTTGRLSSSDPNLQNIPMRTEQGREIRQAFVARPGWTILTADYSQIELRLLAHFCDDPVLKSAFADGVDIHTRVAAEVFKVAEKDVTKEQRGVAKTVNFGVLYGMSAVGLAMRLSIDKKQAAQFIDDYFARYPTVLAYQEGVLKRARESGFVGTILGRRRKFDPTAIRPRSTYDQRNQAEREAINLEIQGSAADLLKVAMLNIHRRLKAEKRQALMILSVHDELVFEVPQKELADVAKLVRAEMTGAMTFGVPLQVDVAAGPNWLDVEDVA